MIYYPAKITHDKTDNAFLVEFPDLPGCLTFGSTLADAQDHAKEALTGYLESLDQRSQNIPRPSTLKGKNVYLIKPDKPVAFAIWLKKQREDQGLSQKAVARKLGISYQTYQRFENPTKSNPTLRTIQKLEDVFGKELLVV
ncbi:MAG: type II toxin-antitoxin system HicB family antitoxin [Spirochaetales bacterium]|nr:type II toxin-antitoxin system HicB family antitoxin [Spirochaetales bacterium]